MKPQVGNLLNFLCRSTPERAIAEEFLSGIVGSEPFWKRVHSLYAQRRDFEYYETIARCHVLCVAASPENNDIWLTVVLDDLQNAVETCDTFDGYEMGTLIGLFQAGVWLHQNVKKPFGVPLLPAMAKYCCASVNREFAPLGVLSNEHVLPTAKKILDRTVREYLWPEQEKVVESLVVDKECMLHALEDTVTVEPMRLPEPAQWLLDSLLHGALNIGKRSHHQLITANLALISH